MDAFQTTSYLSKLLEEHGLSGVIHDDWVAPNGDLPAVRAHWYPEQKSGTLNVHVLVGDQVVIEECFAGLGEGESGMNDALTSFTLNSFHVLLAAFWGKNDPEQVNTEQWTVGNKPYVAYIGNFGCRSWDGEPVPVPDSLFDEIEATIKSETLTGEIHWFRLFFANHANTFDFEALKDNESWEAGRRCLESAAWEPRSGSYSVRLFAILRAAQYERSQYRLLLKKLWPNLYRRI